MNSQDRNRIEALVIAALTAIIQSPGHSHFSSSEMAKEAVYLAELTFAEMERKRL